MSEAYTADPRFDPVRNARELGSSTVPLFFVSDSGAGTTDAAVTVRRDLFGKVPWIRVGLVLFVIWAIWKLGGK